MINVKEKLPEYIITVLEALEREGFEAYAVGGAVRDILLGEKPNDFDVTTSALPEETEQVFSEFPVYKTGIKHGTVSVKIGDEMVEITTFRQDGEYKDSRHPESVSFTRSIEEDLARRDFTVNAMAVGLSGKVIDPFDGMKDLEAGVVRCVGDPEKRFSEDALRIMRCLRFAAKLRFEIEENTFAAMIDRREGLRNISKERIGAEFEKLLLAEYCSKQLEIMQQNGIFDVILPGLKLSEKYIRYIDKTVETYPRRLVAFFKDVPPENLREFTDMLCVPKKIYEDVRLMLYWLNDIRNNPEHSSRLLAYECKNYTTTVEKIAYFEGSWKREEPPVIGGEFNDPNLLRSRSQLQVTAEELLNDFSVPKEILGALISRILVSVLTKEAKNKKSSIYAKIPMYLAEIESDKEKYGAGWRKLKKYNFK